MNVLSIDFDYFQDVTRKQLELYPNGIDRSTDESEVEWGKSYQRFGEELNTINILESEFERLNEILNAQSSDVPVLIANSHVNIYSFIKEQQAEKNDRELSLVNVDMHHDLTNENPVLDCGNWIMKLGEEQRCAGHKMSFFWIANPISCDMYGFTEGEMKRTFGKMIQRSFSFIEDEKFDAIFLCRSDNWLAPHLDKYFTELCDLVAEHFYNLEICDDVDLPRTAYVEIATTIKKVKQTMHDFEPCYD